MFSHEGPRPWHTKPGESRLDAMVEQARAKHYTVEDVKEHRTGSITATGVVADEKKSEGTRAEERETA